MNDGLYDYRHRRDGEGVTIRRIWITLALSVLIHAMALWQWLPHLKLSLSDIAKQSRDSGPLVVQLAPPPRPLPAPPSAPMIQEPRRAKPLVAPREQAKPPLAASKPPAPKVLSQPAAKSSTPAPDPAVAALKGDMLAYLEARRRARGEPAAAPAESSPQAPRVESDAERANRIAALNVGSGRTPTFGREPVSGGVFSIKSLHEHYAEFMFYGWNKDIRRNTSQLIEVRKGNESDIRLAVVRRMIVIIREHEQEDFLWDSQRLGRYVTLSARARDNSGLEDFMMREFFGYSRTP